MLPRRCVLGPLLGLLGTVVGCPSVWQPLSSWPEGSGPRCSPLSAEFPSAFLRWCLTVAATQDPQVVVEADAQAEHGRVVAVMDLARQVGLPRLSIETTRTDER